MKELNKRIFTSILLLTILSLALISNIFLFFVLLLLFYLMFIEFNNIFKKIFKKKIFYYFISLSVVNFYLLFFSLSVFLFLVSNEHNKNIIFLFLLFISISTDTGGFIFGKIFKGKKLTSISPNKTYSGMIGSFLLSILISFIFFRNLGLNFNYLLITILLSSVSQIGDLLISYFKRKANIKNSGFFLPGHGGILDRLDGILLALPLGILIINF